MGMETDSDMEIVELSKCTVLCRSSIYMPVKEYSRRQDIVHVMLSLSQQLSICEADLTAHGRNGMR